MNGAPPVAPRIEAEELPAPRLQEDVVVPQAAERGAPWGMAALVAAGMFVLLGGFSGLAAVEFIAGAFQQAPVLGWAAMGVAGCGFGLIGLGFSREAAGLAALRGVDRIRNDLAHGNAHKRARAARAYVRHMPEAASLLPAINAINDPDAILALLRAGPAASLRARAEALGRMAAVHTVAGIAAMPSPALAGLFVAWRGVRLIRQIAQLHGLRPGVLATLALLRRTALSAGAVVGTEMAANAAAHAVLSSPVLQHVIGDMAAAGVAARRMVVLARAADAACSPVPQ